MLAPPVSGVRVGEVGRLGGRAAVGGGRGLGDLAQGGMATGEWGVRNPWHGGLWLEEGRKGWLGWEAGWNGLRWGLG